jgi:hypothetical protein
MLSPMVFKQALVTNSCHLKDWWLAIEVCNVLFLSLPTCDVGNDL